MDVLDRDNPENIFMAVCFWLFYTWTESLGKLWNACQRAAELVIETLTQCLKKKSSLLGQRSRPFIDPRATDQILRLRELQNFWPLEEFIKKQASQIMTYLLLKQQFQSPSRRALSGR